MQRIIVAIVVFALFFLIIPMMGCNMAESLRAQKEEEIAWVKKNKEEIKQRQKQYDQRTADRVIKSLKYAHDPRTNMCFSFSNDRPSSASVSYVPCENIPPELLIEVKIEDIEK